MTDSTGNAIRRIAREQIDEFEDWLKANPNSLPSARLLWLGSKLEARLTRELKG